jgi:hypothetical protein
MADLKISQLPEYTGYTTGFYFVGNNSGETTTYKISRENLLKNETINAGNVSGSIVVDLSQYNHFIFTLTGNVDVSLQNAIEGSSYLFWVFATGTFSVSTMTIDTGDVYSVGGSLPNPANNKWNLYQGYSINGDFVLTEIGNFGVI